MRSFIIVATVVVLWTNALLALPCAAQETGTLKITVTDARGGAYPHAQVRVISEPDYVAVTNEFGAASVSVPPGEYKVVVQDPQLKEAVISHLVVVGGSTKGVLVKVEPAPPNPSDIHSYQTIDPHSYAEFLHAVNEPALCGGGPVPEHVHSYRFLWLPTFLQPVFMRVDVQPDGTATLQVKTLSGSGGFGMGTLQTSTSRTLSLHEEAKLFSTLADIAFWTLPTRVKVPYWGEMILDGTTWVIEGVRDGDCHVVERYSSSLTGIFSEYFLGEVAKVKPYYEEPK